MSSSGERGGDDPHVLQSLKGGHRNNGITSLAFAPLEEMHLFQFQPATGRSCFGTWAERMPRRRRRTEKTGAISRTREGRSDVSAHAERRRGRESSEWRFR